MAERNDPQQVNQISQRNWQQHCKLYGPILEPAFLEDREGRQQLTQALDHLSVRELKPCLAALQQLGSRCSCNADRAALAFVTGLAHELGGGVPQMVKCFEDAGRLGHRFYLPHWKLANTYHKALAFDDARKHYETAVEYLKAMPQPQEELLAAGYSNLTSCLTMMHQFKAAAAAWEQAQAYPIRPPAYAAAAMLSAATGDREQTQRWLSLLTMQAPELGEKTRQTTQQVLEGNHPHFARAEVSPVLLAGFWSWFSQQEQLLTEQPGKQLPVVSKQLQLTFPFLRRQPNLRMAKSPQGMRLFLHDQYAVGLHHGYAALLRECPQALLERWSFTIVH